MVLKGAGGNWLLLFYFLLASLISCSEMMINVTTFPNGLNHHFFPPEGDSGAASEAVVLKCFSTRVYFLG